MRTERAKTMRLTLLATACGLALSLSACSTPTEQRPLAKGTAEELYQKATRSLARRDFVSAINYFESLNATYPFGEYTQQGQLDLAYAYYKQKEFDNAIDEADRFIKLYPRNPRLDYAYYIKGLSNYSRGEGLFERYVPRDLSRMDQSVLKQSFNDLDTLSRRFPESEYRKESLEMMAHIRDKMAMHELNTAEYYYNRGAMVAAINRVNWLLANYKDTRLKGEALSVLAQSYNALGDTQLRDASLARLEQADPKHPTLRQLR